MKLFRGQPDHDHWRRPFTPTEKANVWAGLGFIFIILGSMKWSTPDMPPFTGKWSWLYNSLCQAFGPYGIPIAMFVVGTSFIVAAVVTWLKEKKGGQTNG